MHCQKVVKLLLLLGLLLWLGTPSAQAAELLSGTTNTTNSCILNKSGKLYCWPIISPFSASERGVYQDPVPSGLTPEYVQNPVLDVRFSDILSTSRVLSQDGTLWDLGDTARQGNILKKLHEKGADLTFDKKGQSVNITTSPQTRREEKPAQPYTYDYEPGNVHWKKLVDASPTYCGIDQNDTVLCFGWNIPQKRQLSKEPVSVGLAGSYQHLAMTAYYNHAPGTLCGIKKEDASIWCTGNLKWRGTDEALDAQTATPIKATGRFKNIVDMGDGFCAHREDNTLWCWGNGHSLNLKGRLPQGETPTDILLPIQLLPGKYKAITANSGSYALLDEKGSIWSWDRDSRGHKFYFGQKNYLEDDKEGYGALLNIPGTSDFTQISIERTSLLGRKADGSVWQWDDRVRHINGLPAHSNANKPYPIPVPND